jgi:hypothetical protein
MQTIVEQSESVQPREPPVVIKIVDSESDNSATPMEPAPPVSRSSTIST